MSIEASIRRLVADQRGSIGVVMALFLTTAVGACALGIDVGSLYLERRTAQGAADLAAMAAAANLDKAEVSATAALAANGVGSPLSISVVKGRYELDRKLLPGKRFEAGKTPYNAARVDVAFVGQLYFSNSFMPAPQITVSAIGTAPAEAVFSIGSRLASVQGGVSNAVLGPLLGGNLSLSAMDYRALLDANITLQDFLPALSAKVGVQGGTYSDVLEANASVRTVLAAAAQAATSNGSTQGAAVLTAILGQTNASLAVPLSSLVDLGSIGNLGMGQTHPGLAADLNLMSLVSALATLSNGSRQVSVDLGAAVPGLLRLSLDLAVGEPAQSSGWIAAGQAGTAIQTAQTRLRLIAEVGGSGLLAGSRIRLPIYIELAGADARLKSVTCPGGNPANTQAVIEAKPALARAWVGDVNAAGLSSFATSPVVDRGVMAQVPLIRVTGSAYAEMSNSSATDVSFSQSDVEGHVVKTVRTHNFLSSLTASLLQSIDLRVESLGLGLGLGTVPIVKAQVLAALTPVTSTLDTLLVPLLETIGLHLGEVDVGVRGLRCGSGVLTG